MYEKEKLSIEEQKKAIKLHLENLITAIENDDFAGLIIIQNRKLGRIDSLGLSSLVDDEIQVIIHSKQRIKSIFKKLGI